MHSQVINNEPTGTKVNFQAEDKNLLSSVRDLCHSTPAWAVDPVKGFFGNFSETNNKFPCNFAHEVLRDQTLRAAFFEKTDEQNGYLQNLKKALTEYIRVAPTLGKITSFLTFFNLSASPLSVQEYEAWFWSVLQYLHDEDDEEWPFEISKDPYNPEWAFSFGGQSFFVVCFTPSHINRKSRHCQAPMIIFQPRWIFDGLGGDQPAGIAVREWIRGNVVAYDEMPASKRLTSFGEGLDWEQYFLPDVNDSIFERCPLNLKSNQEAINYVK